MYLEYGDFISARDEARFTWCKEWEKKKWQEKQQQKKCCCRRRASEEEAGFDFEGDTPSLRAVQFPSLSAAEAFVEAHNGGAWEVVQGQAAGMRGAWGLGGCWAGKG